MSPGGQWIPAGSNYGTALAAGNARDPNMYDSSGAWMGAEGPQLEGNSPRFSDREWATGMIEGETDLGWGNRQIGLDIVRAVSGANKPGAYGK
jgi:hypothetical protein